jgi:serine/threonine-protein kinase
VVAGPSSIEQRATRRVGTVLRGKYRIVAVIGAGGMATVYAAVHRNGSHVAIKVLHEELSLRADTRARFLHEGYAANRVGHPGAVRILDDDLAEDGAAFLVMELLRGETLRARAQRAGGRLPCREVLALGRQLLEVLAAAHAGGVIHRDIKPENLFLTTERVLKVLDFGIARVIEDENSVHATATGTRLGTPAFMPPEVALGRTGDVDARTDLWSAGATLFTLISGQLVHEGESGAEIAVRAATTPPRSLASVAGDAPPGVVALVDRALSFRRDDRWPSAGAMLEALDEVAGGRPEIDALGPAPEAGSGPLSERSRLRLGGGAVTTVSQMSDTSLAMAPTLRGDTDQPATLSQVPSEMPAPPAAPALQEGPRLRWRGALPVTLGVVAALAVGLAAGRVSTPRAPAAAGASSRPGAIGAAAGPSGTPGATTLAAGASAASASPCVSSVECVARLGGAPALCRKEDGVCVALATDACRVLAEPADVGNDATVWIGALWPYRMPDPEHYGPRSANAVELARHDFAETAGGLPPARPGGPRRPLGVVLCDDHDDPARAAAHLVDEVRVPAILGFATSKEVLDLAGATLLPQGILGIVATGAATTIRDIPHRPGEPRLVWRVTTATDALSWPLAALVERVLEPELRAALPPGEPIRLALLRHDSLVGQTTVESRVRELRWNGKTVAENGDAFLQITRADFVAGGDHVEANERTARALAVFRPHVVVDMPPYPALLAAVERAWPADAPHRPRYLTEGTWNDLGEGVIDWRRHALHTRMYPVDFVSSGPATLRFVRGYNERFTPRVTPETALATPYDAFYLVAYAAAALGDRPLTGRALAEAIGRLLPPGEPIEVGPPGIYQAFVALAAGRHIDLQGAATALDLDPETGETNPAFGLYCLAPPQGGGPFRHVASGLSFDAGRREMRGTRRCP